MYWNSVALRIYYLTAFSSRNHIYIRIDQKTKFKRKRERENWFKIFSLSFIWEKTDEQKKNAEHEIFVSNTSHPDFSVAINSTYLWDTKRHHYNLNRTIFHAENSSRRKKENEIFRSSFQISQEGEDERKKYNTPPQKLYGDLLAS